MTLFVTWKVDCTNDELYSEFHSSTDGMSNRSSLLVPALVTVESEKVMPDFTPFCECGRRGEDGVFFGLACKGGVVNQVRDQHARVVCHDGV